jgi:hypothetical protein
MPMLRSFVGLLGGFSFLAVAGSAQGGVITYDEAVDGDLLPSPSASSPVFALGIGTNTFSGEITFAFTLPDVGDDDSFVFSVPGGAQLISISLDIALLPRGAGIFNQAIFALQDDTFQDLSFESVFIPSNDVSMFVANLPLGSGQYAIDDPGKGGGVAFGQFRTAAYTFSLEIAQAIPEPSGIILFGTGLAGLGALGWRRRKAWQGADANL